MMQFTQLIQAIDSHTAGEPTRIITGGLPAIHGASMLQKRARLQHSHDHLRRALVHEPRGHDAIVLAYLLPPCHPDAHLGVVFANDSGYLGMCGHGAIGVATVAIATGMVPALAPLTEVLLDTPVGLVACKVHIERGRPQSVTITNVPSFLFRQRAVVDVHGFGRVAADIAYGGNWFAFVEASQLGLQIDRLHIPVLQQAAIAIREAMIRDGIRGSHPERGEPEIIDHVKLFAELEDEAGSRAFTLCPGAAYDRSPCGTGTSARLAILHAKGALLPGEWYLAESVLGTRFRGRILREQRVGDFHAVVPEIEGSAWITGLPTFVLDPEDPAVHGLVDVERQP